MRRTYKNTAWNHLMKLTFKRDNYICYRCGNDWKKRHKYLTAHHITPRPKGFDELDNLITLCNSCHDFVDERAYQTLDEIKYAGIANQYEEEKDSYIDDCYDCNAVQIRYDPTIYDYNLAGLAICKVEKDWYGYVYGGQRKQMQLANVP